MMHPSQRLPSYVSELLAAERQAPRPSPAAERRVRARVAATVVGTAGAAALAASTAHAAAAGVAVKTGGLALGVKVSVLAFSVGVLGTAGVVGYRQQTAVEARTTARAKPTAKQPAPPRPRTAPANPAPVAMAPPAADSVADEPAAPSPPGTPVAAPSVTPLVAQPGRTERAARPIVPPPARLARSVSVDDPGAETLAGESPLIDAARARIGASDPEHALALLAAHAGRFGHGQLEEEREALCIQALVLAGAAGEARARAHEFEGRFPRSIHLPIVRTAVQSIR